MYPHGINVPIMIKQTPTENGIIRTYSDGKVYRLSKCSNGSKKTKEIPIAVLSKEELAVLEDEMQKEGDNLFSSNK